MLQQQVYDFNARPHTYRHLFKGLFSRTTWVSRHQKGKTILDINAARDDGVAMASIGPYANHLYPLQTDNHASTSSLNFYKPDANAHP